MKAYWDSSALIAATYRPPVRDRLELERGFTRSHTLSEVFSTLTGGKLAYLINPTEAFDLLRDMARYLDYVDPSASAILEAMAGARRKGVRGGRIHDYLHVIAAELSGAEELLTVDRNDFDGLSSTLTIVQL